MVHKTHIIQLRRFAFCYVECNEFISASCYSQTGICQDEF